MKWIYSFLFLWCIESIYAQEYRPVGYSSDIKDAISLPIYQYKKYECKDSPKDGGIVADYKNEKKLFNYLLSKEKHSAWYYIRINYDANLLMDLVPLDPKNDYDFAFFRVTDTSKIRNEIYTFKNKPVVSCISRNSSETSGITGMRPNQKNILVKEGPGQQFVEPLSVKKGELWLLYIDNNAANGNGFRLVFNFQREVIISGQVTDNQSKKGINTQVAVQNDKTGEIVNEVKTDEFGNYEIKFFADQAPYSLFYFNNYYFSNQEILLRKK